MDDNATNSSTPTDYRKQRGLEIEKRNLEHIEKLQEKNKIKESEAKTRLELAFQKQKALKEKIVKGFQEVNQKNKPNEEGANPQLRQIGRSNTNVDPNGSQKVRMTLGQPKKVLPLQRLGSNEDDGEKPQTDAKKGKQPENRSLERNQAQKERSKTSNLFGKELQKTYGISETTMKKLNAVATTKSNKASIKLPAMNKDSFKADVQTDKNWNSKQTSTPGAQFAKTANNRLRLEPMAADVDLNRDMSPKAADRQNSIVKRNIESLNTGKPRSFNYIVNVDDWLKKNRLDAEAKVFVVSAGYPDIKKALERRGWIENPDYDSSCFHLKFSLKAKDIDHASLQEFQIVNHCAKSTTITTKSGLSKSIRTSGWASDEDCDSFFPKCFETFEDSEFNAFMHYYKLIRSESLLKKFVALGDQKQRDTEEYKLLATQQIPTCLNVTTKRLMDADDYIDRPGVWEDITEKEWEIISQGEKTQEDLYEMVKLQNAKRYEKLLKKKKKKRKVASALSKSEATCKAGGDQPEEDEDDVDEEEDNEPKQPRPDLEQAAYEAIEQLKKKYPQTTMNGCNNIWIVKPAGLSRGRGIRLYNSLAEITQQVRTKDMTFVVQKYMENPLLYKKRKLDIRQWVLVRDWNPLEVWFYGECYIRLSTSEYDSTNLKNRYSHLTNNSVNKHAKDFNKNDSFLSQDEFASFLQQTMGSGEEDCTNIFKEKIQTRMKDIVKNSLLCVQDMIENRKNSSEIYGYDFCVDEDLQVWLIEINSSPAWDYSSSVTERLIKMASEDYIKVLVDYGMSKKNKRKNVDTGLFEKIIDTKVSFDV